MQITIKETQNPAIIKFEFQDFITKNQNYEFKNIDEIFSLLSKNIFPIKEL